MKIGDKNVMPKTGIRIEMRWNSGRWLMKRSDCTSKNGISTSKALDQTAAAAVTFTDTARASTS